MNTYINHQDSEYQSIIRPILETEYFHKTKDITHHGVNRFDHSVRVSYYSYKVAKILNLNYIDAARGGLLHDFFLEDRKNKITTLINHPKYALETALQYFELSDIEQDIIRTHMFPVNIRVPRYLESWIVDMVDNVASVYERYSSMSKQLTTGLNFLLVILINSLH